MRDVFERVVLAQLPRAQWFSVSTVSLPVRASLLAQPQAVTVAPRSILPGLNHGVASAGVCVLDLMLPPESLALAPLGVVYQREATPVLLAEMLALWRMPRDVAHTRRSSAQVITR